MAALLTAPMIQAGQTGESLAKGRGRGRFEWEWGETSVSENAKTVELTDVPRGPRVGFAVVEKKVLLWVVKVRLEGDAGVRFEEGSPGATEVDAVILSTGLKENAGGSEGCDGEGGEEIAQERR